MHPLIASVLVVVAVGGAGLAGFALRSAVKRYVDGAIGAGFDRKLEGVKSELRNRESELSLIKSNLLSGRTSRQSLLDKRRIDAVENLWAATLRLDFLRHHASTMAILKIDAVAAQASTDPKIRDFLNDISGGDQTEKVAAVGGETERPFLPDDVWRIFAAYRGLLTYCYMRLRFAAIGATSVMKDEAFAIAPIKDVMPHFSDYLDKYGLSGATQLIDPLRELLLTALRSALDDREGEDQGMDRVIKMIDRFNSSLDGSLGIAPG